MTTADQQLNCDASFPRICSKLQFCLWCLLKVCAVNLESSYVWQTNFSGPGICCTFSVCPVSRERIWRRSVKLIRLQRLYTRWFKYDRDDLCVKSQFVRSYLNHLVYACTHADTNNFSRKLLREGTTWFGGFCFVRLQNNITMNIRESVSLWSGLKWLRIGQSGRRLWTRQWNLGAPWNKAERSLHQRSKY